MFKKTRQHIRILKKLKFLKRVQNTCPKDSEEYKACEHAYLHLRDRYLDTVLGVHDKGYPPKNATKSYREKFKHLGWRFVLRQVGMGVITGIIRRPIQIIVTSALAFVGIKYFEPKFERPPQRPANPIEMQTKKEQMQLLKNKIQYLESEIERLKGLMNSMDDTQSQMVHKPEENNNSSSVLSEDTLDDIQTISKKQGTQEKFVPQQINKTNMPDEKGIELTPLHPGITCIGKNRFVYKLSTSNEHVD